MLFRLGAIVALSAVMLASPPTDNHWKELANPPEPDLSPVAAKWLAILKVFGHAAIEIYDDVARNHLRLYRQRSRHNSFAIRRLSVRDHDIPALVQQMWQQELRVWQSVRRHLSGVEDHVYPALRLYAISIENLLSPEERDDPRIRTAIVDLDNVVPTARENYAADASNSRNWGLRALRRMIGAMLQLHRMARSPEAATDVGQQRRLQQAFDRIYVRGRDLMYESVNRYWVELRKIIARDVIDMNLKCVLVLLEGVE